MNNNTDILNRISKIEHVNNLLKFTSLISITIAGLSLVIMACNIHTLKVDSIRTNRLEIANKDGKVWFTAGSLHQNDKFVIDCIQLDDTFAGMGSTIIRGGYFQLGNDSGDLFITAPGGVPPEITIHDKSDLIWWAPPDN
ncbi:MAG: hypothetical protein ACYC27_14845 [Armatimonadota bacterium]